MRKNKGQERIRENLDRRILWKGVFTLNVLPLIKVAHETWMETNLVKLIYGITIFDLPIIYWPYYIPSCIHLFGQCMFYARKAELDILAAPKSKLPTWESQWHKEMIILWWDKLWEDHENRVGSDVEIGEFKAEWVEHLQRNQSNEKPGSYFHFSRSEVS